MHVQLIMYTEIKVWAGIVFRVSSPYKELLESM